SYRFGNATQGDNLYRPLPKIIFASLWDLSPGNALPFHALNVLLYALTGFLLFIVTSRLMNGNVSLPLVATALFIAHPIHTEVVANIKSLDEILSLIFFVLSLFSLQKFLRAYRKRWLAITMLSYFASLVSKESAITFLAVYPLVVFFFSKLS